MNSPLAARFKAGQCWTYRTPAGYEPSRIVIGAVVTFDDGQVVVCCMVNGAPRKGAAGDVQAVTIPFLPLSADALAQTVEAADGEAAVSDHFLQSYDVWKTDPRGLSHFTVPFEGFLDTMIARQMLDIVQPGPT